MLPVEEAEVYRTGRINGVAVEDIVRNTGAARTLVREDLDPPCTVRGGEVTSRCAHGDAITYQITLSVGSNPDMTVEAAVSKTLPAAVLLGRDVPGLKNQERFSVLVATAITCTGGDDKSSGQGAAAERGSRRTAHEPVRSCAF